jgi:protein-L-isoaspartate(D-aspartate) O-methyltransferase
MTTAFDDERRDERERMVHEQIEGRGLRNARVLEVLRRVPRHRFIVPESPSAARAYDDGAQPIAEGQTISQPYIVALMTDALDLRGTEKVLEIGAGSGYQTAVLALLSKEVIAIERHERLADAARHTLNELGVYNVRLFTGDGSQGWPAHAPYEAILVAAVAPEVPSALLQQLAPHGRLILPVGPENAPQQLLLLTKTESGTIQERRLGEVAFVPLVGVSGYGFPDDLGGME